MDRVTSDFPGLIFQIKRTFMSETTFSPEKSCSLSLRFFELSVEECTVGATNPLNWALQIHSLVDIKKKKMFLYKLIFRDYEIFGRISEEFQSWISIIDMTNKLTAFSFDKKHAIIFHEGYSLWLWDCQRNDF